MKPSPYKYGTQLYEMNHLLETAKLQKAFREGAYKPQPGVKFEIKERGHERYITSTETVDGFAADWRTLNRTVNPVALGIIAQAVGFGGIGIYWHPKAAMCHADTRAGKATWLCTSPGVYPSTTYNAFILPTIRQGSTGAANRSAIILLQKLLKLKEDGNFGPATTQAFIYAQKQNGLTADGICGPASWRALSGADKYLKKL